MMMRIVLRSRPTRKLPRRHHVRELLKEWTQQSRTKFCQMIAVTVEHDAVAHDVAIAVRAKYLMRIDNLRTVSPLHLVELRENVSLTLKVVGKFQTNVGVKIEHVPAGQRVRNRDFHFGNRGDNNDVLSRMYERRNCPFKSARKHLDVLTPIRFVAHVVPEKD